jgi:hypothetical protein
VVRQAFCGSKALASWPRLLSHVWSGKNKEIKETVIRTIHFCERISLARTQFPLLIFMPDKERETRKKIPA